MIQADEGFSSREPTPSTGQNAQSSPYYPDEKVFRLNIDINNAVYGANEIHDRVDCLIENLGAMQNAPEFVDIKLVFRSIEYQLIDIRRIALSLSRIGTIQ